MYIQKRFAFAAASHGLFARLSHKFSCKELGWDNVYRRASVLDFRLVSFLRPLFHTVQVPQHDCSKFPNPETWSDSDDFEETSGSDQELSILGPSP